MPHGDRRPPIGGHDDAPAGALRALYVVSADGAVAGDRVEVGLRDGVVTLQGTVDTPDQRAAAEAYVWRLPAVTAVSNGIRIRAEAARLREG